MPNDADACRQYVVPKLQAAGRDTEPRLTHVRFAWKGRGGGGAAYAGFLRRAA